MSGDAPLRARLALLASLACACASSPSAPQLPAWHEGGGSEVVVEEEERALWAEAGQRLEKLDETDLLLEEEPLSHYLHGVLGALLPEGLPPGAPTPSVHVLRSVEWSAGASPDGMILVSTSLLAALANEAQLAALFGHELAHVLLRHSLAGKRFAAISASTVERMRLSRAQEESADRLGLDLLQKAGYDAGEALGMLAVLGRDEKRGLYPEFESHPVIPDRIRTLRRMVPPDAAAAARRETERYEDAIAGLLLVAAETELEAGLLDRADTAIARHLRLRPDSGRGYFLKAEHERRVAREGRRSPAARRAYERAVELAPDDPDALRALGFLCREAGEGARARELLSNYLRVAPDARDRKIIERYLGEDAAAERSPAGDGAR